MKLDYESLFVKALGALININGGSIESAMDDMNIQEPALRDAIRKDIGWDDDFEDLDDLDLDDEDIEIVPYEED